MDTITVTAASSVQGLRAGETGTIEHTDEVAALIANGRLVPVEAQTSKGKGKAKAPAEEAPVEEAPVVEPEADQES
jgi:hypothetical protein